MLKPTYKLKIGTATIDSTARGATSEDPPKGPEVAPLTVVSIEVDLDMDAATDSFSIGLGNANGLDVAKGDKVIIELGEKDTLTKVTEGIVDSIVPNFTQIEIKGGNAISKLKLNQTYENQTAGAIVEDLANQAGISVGEKEDGLEFPYYVIDSSKNVYAHIQELAKKCGFDAYITPDSKLIFKKFAKTSADHTFEYKKDIIGLEVSDSPEEIGQVVVMGESPASSKGQETAHWLTKDCADYKGVAGSGTVLQIEDATIKTKAAAEDMAKAQLDWIKRKKISGILKILNNPKVKLGDAIEIKEMPNETMNGIFQVRQVSHQLTKTTGFLTTVGWIGIG